MSGYQILKTVLTVLSLLFGLSFLVCTIMFIVKKNKKLMIVAGISFAMIIVCFVGHFITAVKQYYPDEESFTTFEVTSEDLENGVWNVRISHDKGDDLSPQLSWEPVEGANGYVLFMTDPKGNNWTHMIDVTDKTELASGEVEHYVGPYPPYGSHTYIVYVFAVIEPRVSYTDLDNPGDTFETFRSKLSTLSGTNGDTGNIIAYGSISGEYPGKG
ncbi:MAG: hypothetical protein IKE53_06150 [Clostridiales bacterium]|nr:hypothetical protein [Clostridiales bacterium]